MHAGPVNAVSFCISLVIETDADQPAAIETAELSSARYQIQSLHQRSD